MGSEWKKILEMRVIVIMIKIKRAKNNWKKRKGKKWKKSFNRNNRVLILIIIWTLIWESIRKEPMWKWICTLNINISDNFSLKILWFCAELILERVILFLLNYNLYLFFIFLDTFGYVKARFKKHRWYGNLLKSKDPIIFSIGWRRF